MSKSATYQDVIKAISNNYEEIESSIVNQLLLNIPNHQYTAGTYREKVWKSLFDMVVPRKYCIEQGVFIIDSYGHKSKEVDLVIFDELYTPYIFNYGEIKFIPIEAVAGVVQCKSNKLDSDEIINWVESIDELMTSMDSVARMATVMTDNSTKSGQVTQTATRPLKILCSLAEKPLLAKYKGRFDILLSADKERKKLVKIITNEDKNLSDWNDALNHATDGTIEEREIQFRKSKRKDITTNREHLLQDLKVEKKDEEENIIFSLIFQLNQLLMVINNPMLFPHRAYAKCFSKYLKESDQNQGGNDNE